MIAELVAVAAIALLPAALALGILTVIALGLAGMSSDDLDEGRLLRN